jgi:hypothetical protein
MYIRFTRSSALQKVRTAFRFLEMRDLVACKEVIGVSTKPKGYVLEDRDADCWPVGGVLLHRLDI